MHDLLAGRTPAAIANPAVTTGHTVNIGHTEMIRAVFCDEFEIGVDADVLGTISNGDIDRWVADLRGCGLFLPGEIVAIEEQWANDPTGLISALLGEVDEVSLRRFATRTPRAPIVESESVAG